MTYNIWALPVIASHIGDRYALIPEYVKGYDVLALQEVFASGREEFLRELAKEYPYQTKMLDKDGINIYDGGVTIVSRYPIVNQAQYVFPDCTGTDCFADKGVNYAEVIKGGKLITCLLRIRRRSIQTPLAIIASVSSNRSVNWRRHSIFRPVKRWFTAVISMLTSVSSRVIISR